ncbi:hypothetical protein KIPB_004924 [Kipferlia bialata]|uniref:C2H2-type domain-containing protein n=2 Tax=Kipferlia bialata TaxID=797122 RepID=A0A9K3GGW3_9EUKA|nr:hypothetical protein KIPB_004924 [Kipferlia bialata]|eukprot:g4924.t1
MRLQRKYGELLLAHPEWEESTEYGALYVQSCEQSVIAQENAAMLVEARQEIERQQKVIEQWERKEKERREKQAGVGSEKHASHKEENLLEVRQKEELCRIAIFHCDECDSFFDSLKNLLHHEASHHGLHGSTFPCHTCGREFETRLDRLQHVIASGACGGEQAAFKLYLSSMAEEDCTYLKGDGSKSEVLEGVTECESSEDTDPAVDTVCVSPPVSKGTEHVTLFFN